MNKKWLLTAAFILALLFSLATGGQFVKLAHGVLSVSVELQPYGIYDQLVSPGSMMFTTNNISVSISAADPEVRTGPQWITYSLDGAPRVIIRSSDMPGVHSLSGYAVLWSLSDGVHSIVGSAITWFGQAVVNSSIVYFIVNTRGTTEPVSVIIESPQNWTYSTNTINVSITGYCPNWGVGKLDYNLDQQGNITIYEQNGSDVTHGARGTAELSGLRNGPHRLEAYALEGLTGLVASSAVYFTIDTPRPGISILSPQNNTYGTTSLPLSFAVNETASWLGYCLDRQTNVTIAGNTTLPGLSDGSHSLTVYANNTIGNTGASETIYFSIAQPESFPTTLVIAVLIASVVVGAGLLVYFKKRKH
jgi:hypothetical protein